MTIAEKLNNTNIQLKLDHCILSITNTNIDTYKSIKTDTNTNTNTNINTNTDTNTNTNTNINQIQIQVGQIKLYEVHTSRLPRGWIPIIPLHTANSWFSWSHPSC